MHGQKNIKLKIRCWILPCNIARMFIFCRKKRLYGTWYPYPASWSVAVHYGVDNELFLTTKFGGYKFQTSIAVKFSFVW